jgi:SAM-dependent methyltransferase
MLRYAKRGVARLERRVRRGQGAPEFKRVRAAVASRWLRGAGIEIGALHQPLEVPRDVSVDYVDRLRVPALREQYPELIAQTLVEPDIVDDGEQLGSISDGSQDFVIANHFIEHCEDPIGTIKNMLRVLRAGGIVFLAVPDKRHTFDRDRPLTTLQHLDRDHEQGPAWSRRAHFEEWVRLAEHGSHVEARTQALMDEGYSIHFHVWTLKSFSAFLEHCRERDVPLEVAALVENNLEFLAILRRTVGSAK